MVDFKCYWAGFNSYPEIENRKDFVAKKLQYMRLMFIDYDNERCVY